ncbi:N-acetylgalactosamine-N,N'-diacetylbacillosaminyl-diphospho-undecaprenol 4-alpha-N-acetylgalactosaminyltransferase [Meiothermus luteus]|uniref:N-acetylgalactosamine-N, N'-diacetylbacillosaminyl-diphospho-undecaprenol 4-alpha-N-acetylgalactosaminyltransferase n=1 Tax=Meiothermus luteus TaxID=2026184 RepID=A0A399F215_9DEIN|nr:glycosyltransferase [Meiothermus luteus]RIH89746.1 N-acetylgalactosamine-N,N'-diacetylbacillosaminyl-diphospho-undecaprenol 4-alpha-N-acetylgalactosaminyltransferase [Meiothermus luteus]RMH57807.1 MAG: glycosyltransferase [Deinococcota bacterium]
MRRRILFYLPVLGYGGVERVTQHLAQGLADRYDILIAGQGAEPNHLLAQAPLPPNVTLLPAPTQRAAMKHRAIPTQALRLVRLIQRHRPHLLVSAWPRVHLTVGLAYRLLPSPQRPRWVLTEHNEIQGYLGRGWRAALKAWLLQRWTHRADAYVAVSQKVAQLSGAVYPKARFRVIYNPAITPELEQKAQEPVAHPWFQGQTPVVLSVGRLEAMKDFPTLLQAFRLVLERVPEARLVILGEGVLRKELEALAEGLGLQDKVWMPGFDPNPYRYMARATVFTLSSAYGEASPLVLSEAMYLGKPVVLTRFATALEFVDPEQDGLLVEVGNPEALAQGLVRVLQDPGLQKRLGAQARTKAQARFSVEQAVRNYATLFEELIESA